MVIAEEDIVHRFKYKSLTYGWFQKSLYRLPYNLDNRYYNLNKVSLRDDGRYKLGSCNKSIKQLEFLTLNSVSNE